MPFAATHATHAGTYSSSAGGGAGDGGGAPMPAAHAATTSTSAATSFAMALPSGVVSGSLMIARVEVSGAGGVGRPTGWTNLETSDNLGVWYRFATGAESSPVTVTTGVSAVHYAARVTRYTGHHASAAPERSTDASGSSTSPNPGSLTPSWGMAATGWEAIFGAASSTSVTSYPTDYSSGTFDQGGGTAGIAVAYRSFEATSQNPGAFTISPSRAWQALTIAIRPAA